MSVIKNAQVIYVESKGQIVTVDGVKQIMPSHVKICWSDKQGRRWNKFIECTPVELEEIARLEDLPAKL